jgi:hypothetical protein
MGMECIVPIPMCVTHSFGTLAKIETEVKMKLTHIQSKKKRKRKKEEATSKQFDAK